jgi:hypothetical protein
MVPSSGAPENRLDSSPVIMRFERCIKVPSCEVRFGVILPLASNLSFMGPPRVYCMTLFFGNNSNTCLKPQVRNPKSHDDAHMYDFSYRKVLDSCGYQREFPCCARIV